MVQRQYLPILLTFHLVEHGIPNAVVSIAPHLDTLKVMITAPAQ